MQIVHVVESLDPAQGGPPRSVQGIATAQAKLGLSVVVASKVDGAESAGKGGWYNKDGVKYIVGARSFTLPFTISSQTIVHVHGLWRPLVTFVCLICRLRNIPYTVAPMGMLHPWALTQKPIRKKFALVLLWKAILDRAQILRALNENEAEFLDRFKFRSSIAIIGNGVDLTTIPANLNQDYFRTSYPRLGQHQYIIFLGRLHLVKGIDFLLAAFSELCRRRIDVDLVIAGPGEREATRLLEKATLSGLSERIHYIGMVDGKLKWSALSGAICLCAPSRQEGFSMSITEAMACGTPVVISKYCNFPEVQEYGCGAVVELNDVSIADALQRMVEDKEWRSKCGEAARCLVKDKYTWDKVAKNLYHVSCLLG